MNDERKTKALERDEAAKRGTLWARFAMRSSRARAAVVVGAFAAYILAYLPLRAQVGIAAGLLAMVPAALAGWAFGLRGGLLAGLVVTPLHTILMNLAGYPGWDVILRETSGLGPVAVIAVGVAAGYWSDLIRALQQQIAERKRAEGALQESEQRFSVLSAASFEGIVISDRGQIVDANEQLAAMLGYERPEMIGLPVEKFVAPESLELVWQHIRSGSEEPYEHLSLRKDGSTFPVEIRAKSLPYKGRIVRVTAIRDITERKQAEETLRDSQARLAGIIDSAMDAIVSMDADQRIILFNPAAERMFRCPAAEVIGQLLDRFIPERFREAHREHIRAYGRTNQTSRSMGALRSLTCLRADGEEFPAEISISQTEMTGQKIYTAILRDVTERVRAEGILRLQSAALEAAANGIVITDRDGNIQWANPAFTSLTGFTTAEALGKNPRDLIKSGKQDRAFYKNMWKTILAGQVWRGELINRRKDGTLYTEEMTLTPLKDERGEVIRFIAVKQDVSERKRAEAERQALDEIMQGVVVTTDLQEFLHRAHGSIARVIYAENFFITLYHKDTGLFEEAYSVDKYDPPAPPHALGKSINAYVFRTGRPLLLTQEHFDELAALGEVELVGANSPSWLGVPLKTPAETIGVMVVQHYEAPNLYSARDAEFLASIAGQVALAVERKRAEAEVRRRGDEFAALYETARDLAAQHDLPALLHTIAERARALLHAPGGGVYLYDPARGDLEMILAVGTSVPVGARLQMGEGMAGRVAQTRQPLIVDDYQTWEGRSPQYNAMSFRAVVQAPMLYGGELIGVLVAHESGESERKFTEADTHLLSLFAEYAASAVHAARLWQETRRRAEELAALAHVSAALRVAQTIDEMLPRLLDETLAVLATDASALWLYDAARGELRQAVARGWFTQIDEAPMQPGEGVAGGVFATGEAHLSREFARDPRARASTRGQIPPGWGGACVPIRTTAQVVGVLFVAVPLPRELTPEEMHLLTALAEIAGNAVHRMRLHEQTEQRLRRIQALRAIDMAVTASLDLGITLDVLLDHALTQLRVAAAAVLLLNPQTQTLEYAAGRGFHSAALQHARLHLGEGYAGRVALDRRIVHVPNVVEAGGDLARALLLADEAFVAYYGVPLTAKGQVKGVLEIFHRAPLDPDPEWLDFLETLAGQAAIAIDSAELFESLQRSNAELTLAYDATIEGWARALELRDRETEGHTRRVAELTLRLARAAGMSDADLVHLRRGALLHDIGKMGIADAILLKPGPLTDEEWALMRQHPRYAHEMLSSIAFLRPALEIPYCHHEKWDGTGYPRGLKGDAIPLAARIFAVADVWDALRSDRPYRSAWPEERVREHIRSQAGAYFDPQVVEIFLELEPKGVFTLGPAGVDQAETA